tara:strand:+ start:2955 stop:3233 length:279 start_codon:yes stop_codon:yes gene_type:complete
MSDDINLKGTVIKPDTVVQDFIKWVGYALVVFGMTWGVVMPVLFNEKPAPFAYVLGSAGVLTFVASGSLFVALSKIIELLREIRDANHTIVD